MDGKPIGFPAEHEINDAIANNESSNSESDDSGSFVSCSPDLSDEFDMYSEPDGDVVAAFDETMASITLSISDAHATQDVQSPTSSDEYSIFCSERDVITQPQTVEDLRSPLILIGEEPDRIVTTSPTEINSSDASFLASTPRKQRLVITTDGIVEIARLKNFEKETEKRDLSWGVKFELARLVSFGLLRDQNVTDNVLKELEGPDTKPAKIPELFGIAARHDKAFARETAARTPWEELEREEDALKRNPFSGLGFDFNRQRTDYGGKVDFSGQVTFENGELYIQLRPPTLGPSCRFKRRFGSFNFLQLKPASKLFSKNHETHLRKLFFSPPRPFVIFDAVFRPFYAKDRKVFLYRTNEVYDGSTISILPSSPRLSLGDFINWANPLDFNTNQLLPKYASRIALGLSTSVPGLWLDAADILDEPDKTSPKGSDLTDGCGYINKHALITLFHHFKWRTFPVAVQMRLGGNKGVLLLHPTDASDWPRVWIRSSQTKIRFPQPSDPTNLIIDILRPSYIKTPARLSPETIINMAHNGVPPTYFIDVLKSSVDEFVASLTDRKGSDAMMRLWHTIAHQYGVFSARKARDVPGEARANGYIDRQDDISEDDLNDEGHILKPRPLAWWTDETSGCPSSLWEAAMALIAAGFTPDKCWMLRDKLKQMMKIKLKQIGEDYHYPVTMSCSAIIVPDPYGVLRPDEIQLRSSQNDLPMSDGLLGNVVLGDVLFTRHPCTLPTGVRKFRAVDPPELKDYQDVIVCSILGPRRQVEIVDGDYDGDIAEVYWDSSVVSIFTNAQLVEHASLDQNFSNNTGSVSDFLSGSRIASLALDVKLQSIHDVLLDGLQNTSSVGIYAGLQDFAIYTKGYDDPETMYLGRMKNEVLDRRKHGGKVVGEVFRRDRKIQDGWKQPSWKKLPGGNEKTPVRPLSLGEFIMDRLENEAKVVRDTKGVELDNILPEYQRLPIDGDLTAPWSEEWKKAEEELDIEKAFTGDLKKELSRMGIELHIELFDTRDEGLASRRLTDLKKIKNHVEALRVQYGDLGVHAKTRKMSNLEWQARLRALSKSFASTPILGRSSYSDTEISRLSASYAYLYDAQKGAFSQFPWVMAMRELTNIKCRAGGTFCTVTSQFNEHSYVKLAS